MAKIRKKKKTWNIVFKLSIFVFILTIAVRLISLQVEIAQKKRELSTLEQKVESETQENEELQEMLDAGLDEDYIMKIAREKLGYVLPDERVYVDVTQE